MVRLDPITSDNVGDVFALAVAPGQQEFVATNAWSLAEAYAEYDIAWPRAVVDDDTVVGFLMLEIDPRDENGRPFWLWRLMIDADHQRRGFGRAALDLAVEHVRLLGADELYTSWVPGDTGPEPFYMEYGFEPTGEIDDDEIVARFVFSD
ncbi:MAG TPA: GNAT family N-acetyltransferase [Ilumatobacteraceae bacterium]|nr:GNAT family N-acetyltransferase [Ilumatobacteraceae bacterium]